MALSILADSTRVQVVVGYESGHTMVFVQGDPGASFERLYSAHVHTQPSSYYKETKPKATKTDNAL